MCLPSGCPSTTTSITSPTTSLTPSTSAPSPPQYGCWTIVTPPWTDASTDFETGFDQNDEEKLECCVESTVRW